MRFIFFLLFMLLFCPTAYAEKNKDLDTYFPLEIGNTWVYSAGLDYDLSKQVTVKFYDKELGAFVLVHKSSVAGSAMIATKKLGDRIIETASLAGDDFRKLIPPHIVLVSPLKKGSKWEYMSDKEYKLLFKVIGYVDLSVKAGNFTKVIKIEKYTMNTKDRKKDWGKSYIYYAPNVGLIKEEFVEETGKLATISELIDYKIAGKE